jgi:hypothetical protein
LGPWSSDERMKNIGKFYLQFWREGMEGWIMAIATRYLGVRYSVIVGSLGLLESTPLIIFSGLSNRSILSCLRRGKPLRFQHNMYIIKCKFCLSSACSWKHGFLYMCTQVCGICEKTLTEASFAPTNERGFLHEY